MWPTLGNLTFVYLELATPEEDMHNQHLRFHQAAYVPHDTENCQIPLSEFYTPTAS